MRLKLRVDLQKYKAGETIEVKDDGAGTPLDRYWRDRLKDSAIDNCVEIVKPKTKGK